MDMQAFLNTAVGRQMKAMAEKHVAERKTERQGYQEELNTLLAKGGTRTNIAQNRGETRFVKMEGVLSFYSVGDTGTVKDLKPLTMETFQSMDKLDQMKFKEKYPAEYMAIEYGSFKQDLSKEFFEGAVVANNTDYKELELYLNRPTVSNEFDYHQNLEVSSAYDSFEDYKQGLTKELKTYRQDNSVEGRIERQNRISELQGKIKEIDSEVGGSGE
ncbi:hypothetical protein DFO73_107107 [Cytobacillus oceanisediminis]|uniref:Uncharacterized protein n=1 Tax=Cytobacillus oceanisediminis TaxID=665099 RepID=A0A2V2ZVU3_9BACI|nr:hypothetical protein [Cytobacillus oceanisediminis]PWW27797.1 hypothetical protein DFO73_107107 [Cytobacillus oceanisediminis]